MFMLLALMAVQGVANLRAQWAIIGEFSNLPQEELLDWIMENTKPSESHNNAIKILQDDPKSVQNCRRRSRFVATSNHVCKNFTEIFPLKVKKISVISADI